MADILFEGDPFADPASEMRKRARENRAAEKTRKSNVIFEDSPKEDRKALLPGRASRVSFEERNAEWTRRHELREQAKNAGQQQEGDTGRSDVYYHTSGRNSGRSLKSTFGIIGIVVMGLIFLYWILATKNGANNFWGKVNAIVAPTGKILSSKPMFTKGTSQLFSNASIPAGATTSGSSMQQTG